MGNDGRKWQEKKQLVFGWEEERVGESPGKRKTDWGRGDLAQNQKRQQILEGKKRQRKLTSLKLSSSPSRPPGARSGLESNREYRISPQPSFI